MEAQKANRPAGVRDTAGPPQTRDTRTLGQETPTDARVDARATNTVDDVPPSMLNFHPITHAHGVRLR